MSPFHTYKHVWNFCLDCGNARTRKVPSRYFDSGLPRLLAERLPPAAREIVLPDEPVLRDPSSLYAGWIPATKRADLARTGEAPLVREVEADLARIGIDLPGKRVLEVGCGSGLLIHGLSHKAKHVVATEWNPDLVATIRDALGIETHAFEFVHDRIHEVLKQQFDIVIARFFLSYCLDLPRFLKDLREIVAPGGVVLIFEPMPTMGRCLRWQFKEYIFQALYHPETLVRYFAEAGFRVVERESCRVKHFLEDSSAVASKAYWNVIRSFSLYYHLRARILNPGLPRDLGCGSSKMTFTRL